MSNAADIPPELFKNILFFVCEKARGRNYSVTVIEQDTMKLLTNCALTCVYWAHTCRKEIFRNVPIYSHKDMCAFSALVSNTPKRFTSISEYVWRAILVQRADHRPWLHLLHLQPSLFLAIRRARISFRIIDSTSDAVAGLGRQPTHSRLFSGLPRTLPPSCYWQCRHLILEDPYFRTPNDLNALVGRFVHRSDTANLWDTWYLTVSNATWNAKLRFHSNLLMRNPLEITPCYVTITAKGPLHTPETAWLAFTAALSHMGSCNIPSILRHENNLLRLLPSAQQAILDIGKRLCQYYSVPQLNVLIRMRDPVLHRDTSLHQICELKVGALPDMSLHFYASQPTASRLGDASAAHSGPIPVEHIAVISIFINCGVTQTIGYLWEEIVETCARQEGFRRLQLQFPSRDDLVQFMVARRAAFARLVGLVTLFHETTGGVVHGADFVTLEDLGDLKQNIDFVY